MIETLKQNKLFAVYSAAVVLILLGTDKLGRDTTQVSLFMTICLVILLAIVGSIVGITSGYFGGKVEMILMRFADMMLAFPSVVLAIAIAGIYGRGSNVD